MKMIRRTLFLALLSLGATACGTSSILAPDCEDPETCEYVPDNGSYVPDNGS